MGSDSQSDFQSESMILCANGINRMPPHSGEEDLYTQKRRQSVDGNEMLWNTARWFALYTRSRHEKSADHELKKRGVQTFLPLRKISRRWSDRIKLIEEPLFKGYLFVHTPLKRRWDILNTPGIVRFVGPSAANPLEVPQEDLEIVKRFLEEKIQVDPFPYLRVGERVYIRSGPFKGVEGFIVRKNKHCRLVLSFDVLMQSIAVEVDQACVEQV